MNKNYILLLFFLMVSCTKDLELPYEKPDHTMVVNCLFSEEETWKVILTRVKSFSDQSDSFVEDARVMIVPESKDTIHLEHSKDGIYGSNEKPMSGIQYRLIVLDSKGNTISAQSSIPVKPIISEIKPSTQNTIYYSNANLSDYFVLPLDFKISANDQPNFVRFKLFTFNTKWGYTRYMVTKETITELRKWKLPEDFLSDLEKLVGISMSNYEYWGIIREIGEKHDLPFNGGIGVVLSKLKEIKVTTRYEDSFQSGYLFSNSIGLNNVSKDIWNILGEYRGMKDVSLFVTYIPVMNKNHQTDYKEEYWLEVTGMSEDYYKYQKTYIKQVENKNNPFASVIEVHSNITNGVGIFAGYNRQKIHYHDY
ncbi:MAG: DUF4249 domain-containing protein [Prolixibacteraceae bacterium]|nr:DUF4249 domain-containing protein [Prolixibacteraceae bacterium]